MSKTSQHRIISLQIEDRWARLSLTHLNINRFYGRANHLYETYNRLEPWPQRKLEDMEKSYVLRNAQTILILLAVFSLVFYLNIAFFTMNYPYICFLFARFRKMSVFLVAPLEILHKRFICELIFRLLIDHTTFIDFQLIKFCYSLQILDYQPYLTPPSFLQDLFYI